MGTEQGASIYIFVIDMSRVKSNITLLRALVYLPPKQKRLLLDNLTKDQLHSIAEIAANTLAGVISPPSKVKTELSKRKTVIRKIASKEISDNARRDIVKKNSSTVTKLLAAALQKLSGNV